VSFSASAAEQVPIRIIVRLMDVGYCTVILSPALATEHHVHLLLYHRAYSVRAQTSRLTIYREISAKARFSAPLDK